MTDEEIRRMSSEERLIQAMRCIGHAQGVLDATYKPAKVISRDAIALLDEARALLCGVDVKD